MHRTTCRSLYKLFCPALKKFKHAEAPAWDAGKVWENKNCHLPQSTEQLVWLLCVRLCAVLQIMSTWCQLEMRRDVQRPLVVLSLYGKNTKKICKRQKQGNFNKRKWKKMKFGERWSWILQQNRFDGALEELFSAAVTESPPFISPNRSHRYLKSSPLWSHLCGADTGVGWRW